jgi:hypothetical protein
MIRLLRSIGLWRSARKQLVYQVLQHQTMKSLEEAVTQCLAQEWKLNGGLVLTYGNDGTRYFAQAMTRWSSYEKPKQSWSDHVKH